MKIKLIIIMIFSSNFMYGQLATTDVGVTAQVIMVNANLQTLLTTLGAVEGTTAENSATNASSLTESAAQGETMIEQLEQVQDIQEQLETVKQTIKDIKQIKQSLIYIVKIIKDTNYLLSKANTLEYKGMKVFDSNQINNMNEQFDAVLDIVNVLMETIQNVIKDNVFKMDEGARLNIILDISDKIKKEYNKIHKRRTTFEKLFNFLLTEPIKG